MEGRKFDSLSPYLFVLVADVLTKMINLGKGQDIISGLGGFENVIVSLQYADDTILFSTTDYEKLRNLKLLLYLFEKVSGLKINICKYEAIWMGGSVSS